MRLKQKMSLWKYSFLQFLQDDGGVSSTLPSHSSALLRGRSFATWKDSWVKFTPKKRDSKNSVISASKVLAYFTGFPNAGAELNSSAVLIK